MKKVLLFIIALIALAAQYAFAQGEQATVYLNNGSILNGQLAKSNTENKYRMRISNGSVIFFNGNDVKSIRNNTTPLPNATGMTGEAGTAYLHNGSIVKGKIRKSDNSDKYRAVLPNGSIFFFSGNLLKSIEYEQADDWGDEQEDEWGDNRGNVLAQAPEDDFFMDDGRSTQVRKNGSMAAKPVFRSDEALQIWYRRGSSRANAGRTLFFVGLGCAVGGALLLDSYDEGTQIAGAVLFVIAAPVLVNIGIPIWFAGVGTKAQANKAMRLKYGSDVPATAVPHFQLNLHGNGLGLAYVF